MIVFASNNEHKKKEISRLFIKEEILLPKDLGFSWDVEENGQTFIDNAIIKAESLYKIVKRPVLADDSGLIVEAFPNILGVKTARFGCEKRKLSSKEQNLLLLEIMKDEENRKASFICALVLYINEKQIYIIQESVDGFIARERRGEEGFGYDPIFLVENTNKSAAEMEDSEKDLYSHRARAVRKLVKLLT